MNGDTHIPAWQKLGFQRDFLDAIMPNMVAMSTWWNGPPALPDDVTNWVFSACMWGMNAFALGSMGYDNLPEPMNDWREAGRKLVAAAVYCFFGSWRDRFKLLGIYDYDRQRARAELQWSDYYREGLAVALSLGDWSSADRLLEWPAPDLRYDEGTNNRTPEDNAYQIVLASGLRGQPNSVIAKQRALIERGRRRRPKLLLTAADALLANDAGGLTEALRAYLHHYRQRDIRPNRVDSGVCIDGTALWHLARRRGLGEIALPRDLMILIARP